MGLVSRQQNVRQSIELTNRRPWRLRCDASLSYPYSVRLRLPRPTDYQTDEKAGGESDTGRVHTQQVSPWVPGDFVAATHVIIAERRKASSARALRQPDVAAAARAWRPSWRRVRPLGTRFALPRMHHGHASHQLDGGER